MKPLIISAMCVVTLCVTPRFSAGISSGGVAKEESDRVINLIYQKAAIMYRQYHGVESLRKEVVNEYDPATGTLKRSTEATMVRKDFTYEEPEVKVLSCTTDGKVVDPSKFRVMKSMPVYPVFDEHGRENYETRIIERKKINGRDCYRVQVSPKKETPRHFSGSMYFSTDTLESVLIEGTLAELKFPIRQFEIKLYTGLLEGFPVVTSGEVRVRVKVPIFYPDTLIVSTITVMKNSIIR